MGIIKLARKSFAERILRSPLEKARLALSSIPKSSWSEVVDVTEGPEVLWSSHLYSDYGYAKMGREISLRLAHSFRLAYTQEGFVKEPTTVDNLTRSRLNTHFMVKVSEKAPFVRAYTPVKESDSTRHRICFTMMETSFRVHKDFIDLLNKNYDELWTPSKWNLGTFTSSGLKIPAYVVPLGVNPFIYRPCDGDIPEARLLSTSKSGATEKPKGFLFVSVGVPTFRKGMDIIVSAFERAFWREKDVALVLATTYAPLNAAPTSLISSINLPKMKSRIYELSGRLTEYGMAKMYNACHCYVTASRGEGWNLPVTEAASCGLPVIAPRSTAHLDYLNDGNSFLFSPDGESKIPGAGSICPWYDGMPFCHFGKKSVEELSHLMRLVYSKYKDAKKKSYRLRRLLETKFTWDHSASVAASRLMEVQG